MDQIFRYTNPIALSLLGIAGLPAIIGVILVLTGIWQILIAESDDKIQQGVKGALVVLAFPLILLGVYHDPNFLKGRRARPGEAAYEENKRREKGPHAAGVRIGFGIALIILVYFAWDFLFGLAGLLLILLGITFSSW